MPDDRKGAPSAPFFQILGRVLDEQATLAHWASLYQQLTEGAPIDVSYRARFAGLDCQVGGPSSLDPEEFGPIRAKLAAAALEQVCDSVLDQAGSFNELLDVIMVARGVGASRVVEEATGEEPMPSRPIEEETPPPLPRLDLKATFSIRRELFARLWKAFESDNRVAGDNYRSLVGNAVDVLGGDNKADPSAVADSVAYLLGTEATDRSLWDLAWRLAGNRDRLRDGQPVRPWSLQREPEWVPIHVTAARPGPRRFRGGKKAGCDYTFQALAGSYCPGTLTRWWSRPQYTMFSRELGCSPPWGKYPLRHATELVGLRLFGLFTPEECKGGRAGFRRIACGSSMVAHNRAVLAVRGRSKPCPRKFDHPCHRCGVGYLGRDACEFATHARAYEARACLGCGNPAAAVDPEEPTGLCVACATKDRFKNEEDR